jgi:phage gp16-like protein
MTATAARSDDKAARRPRVAKIQIAKKELAIDDETYRALLRRKFGVESSTALTLRQLDELLDHFKAQGFKPAKAAAPARAGSRRLATNKYARKVRALWISLYHLGVVRDPAEAALVAYVQRVTGGRGRGLEALEWLKGEEAYKAIEALKAWAEREGGVDWSADGLGAWAPYLPVDAHERFAVVSAQWRRLRDLDAVSDPQETRWWNVAIAATDKTRPDLYEPEDWFRVTEWFGRAIREAMAARS